MSTVAPVAVHADAHVSAARYADVRSVTQRLAAPLSTEDCVVQSMPDASPVKWHLAHTTWFFETFVLDAAIPGRAPFDPAYRVLYNSYYNGIGAQHPRAQRGLVTRPSLAAVLDYRAAVDECLGDLFERDALAPGLHALVELGLHHEQQHQELILMDLKHLLSCNPAFPAYRASAVAAPDAASPLSWIAFDGGLTEIGSGGEAFAFDNEGPRHRTWLEPWALASRPVANGEFLEFVLAGGYREPRLWLSDGWAIVTREGWRHPRYWHDVDGVWHEFTLAGLRPLDPGAPACHLSYYEADAYAAWRGARLPTEQEWESAARSLPVAGNFVESGHLHPRAATGAGLLQMYGDAWEWTRSAYAPYPGFRPAPGAVGEYNGKFMANQYVLRGGACVSPRSHLRATYRNFFYPHTHWQFSGLRLAQDLPG